MTVITLDATNAQTAMTNVIVANHEALGQRGANTPYVTQHQDRHMTWVETGISAAMLNGVRRFQVVTEKAEPKIRQLVTYFKSRNLPMSWIVHPTDEPTDLGHRLEQHGFSLEASPIGMAIDIQTDLVAQPSPSGLCIKRVDDEASLQTFIDIATDIFEYPEIAKPFFFDIEQYLILHQPEQHQLYVGYLDGQPVATSMLSLDGQTAGIYGVATVPEVRRQGIGSAMVQHALRNGYALGYRTGILSASEIGASVYRRLGFKAYCQFQIYILGSNE